MSIDLPISAPVWQRLVEANAAAVQVGWAQRGVFGTGIGPSFQPGSAISLLYVGKSAGPRGHRVGSCDDQAESVRSSSAWMIFPKRNPSPFWKFVDRFGVPRERIAWTNVCKMDRIGGALPPTNSEWLQVKDACLDALSNEISILAPQVIVFATSRAYEEAITAVLAGLDYCLSDFDLKDGWTTCHMTPAGRAAVITRHPQGWSAERQVQVSAMVKRLLNGQGHLF